MKFDPDSGMFLPRSKRELERGCFMSGTQQVLLMASSGGGGGVTPCDLLLKFDDQADASTTFTDTSGNSRTVTGQGNAQIDTAQAKYGAGAALFDGTGDYLDATLPAFNYAANDFYMAGWFRFAAGGDKGGLLCLGASGNNYYVHHIIGRLFVGDGSNNIMNPLWSPSTDTWYHVALSHTMSGGEAWYLFVDGTAISNSGASLTQTSPTNLQIGARSAEGAYLNGWADDVVLKQGDAVHTSNFTPAEWV